jgi:hypothetical protein
MVAVVLSAGLAWASHHMWIVHTGDSLCFLPVSLFEARFGQMVNPYFHVGDTLSHERFLWHGWAQPMLLARLSPAPSYSGIGVAWALLVGLQLACVLALLQRLAVTRTITCLGLVLCFVEFDLSGGARPELLGALVVAIAAWRAVGRSPTVGLAVEPGALLGVLAVTQPTGALTAATLLGAYWAHASLSVRQWWPESVMTGTTALGITILLTVWLYPFAIGDWLNGLLQQGRIRAQLGPAPAWPFFLSPGLLPRTLWLIAGAFGIASLATAAWRSAGLPRLFVVLAALSLFALIHAGLAYPQHRYNLDMFLPVLGAFACMAWQRRVNQSGVAAPWLGCVAILMLVATSIPLGKSLIEISAAAQRADWVRHQEIVARIHALQMEVGIERVAIGHNFEVAIDDLDTARRAIFVANGSLQRGLFADYDESKVPPRLIRAAIDRRFDVIVLEQAFTGLREPPDIADFHLVENRFSTPAMILGYAVGRTPKAYNYAVYRRTQSTIP